VSIAFITSYFNFTDSKRIKNNYIEFRKRFPYKLYTAELALNHQQFFIDDSLKFTATENNMVWQKERLLNLLIETLPHNTDIIVWVDCDIVFNNNSILKDIDKVLNQYPVAQCFDQVYESSINSTHNNISFAQDYLNEEKQDWPAIGFSWAMRRNVIDDGLFDLDILGNNDSLQLIAWLGWWDHQQVLALPPHMRQKYLLWAIKNNENVNGRIGCIKGSIEHLYHGNASNRQYWAKNKILQKHMYDPETDITMHKGLIELLPNKPTLKKDIYQYFIDRKDDE
jgi:hypothetical protein